MPSFITALSMTTLLLLSGTSLAATPKNTLAVPTIPQKHILVDISTTQGTITLDMEDKLSPKTVSNFLKYADEGFYNGTIVHRVIANFMIQGGGMTPDMNKKPTHKPIPNESANGLSNRRGTIAMARTNNPDSATSQFFINLVDNNSLNGSQSQPGYTVFGKVVSGMDVVEKIGNIRTIQKGSFNDVPAETITIKKVTVRQ